MFWIPENNLLDYLMICVNTMRKQETRKQLQTKAEADMASI